MKKPNIIWIFPDEWRHDALGYAGNSTIRTPNLDALARASTVVSRAYCESPICQPSRASLLTCSYPRDHGMSHNWQPAGMTDQQVRRLMPRGDFPGPEVDTFLRRLQAAGYFTAEVGKMHFYNDYDKLGTPEDLKAYGFDEVSEEYDKHVLLAETVETGYTRYLDGRGLLAAWREHEQEQTRILFGTVPGRWALSEALAPEHTLDAYIGRQSCESISRLAERDEPFFLWTGFVGPHPPFDGPPPFADLYDPATIPLGPIEFDGYTDNVYGEYTEYMNTFFNTDTCTEDDYRAMAKHYYAKITLIDDQIGRIVRALELAGVAQDTWIVFSSDHGELLGDHGLMFKCVFYEASVRVPALIRPPVGVAAGEPRIDTLVQGIDVVATILDLAGADRSGFYGHGLLDGRTDSGRDAVFSQIAAFTMVATDDFKLVVETATLEPQILHNLRLDPEERRDLLGGEGAAAVVDELVDRHLRPFLAGSSR